MDYIKEVAHYYIIIIVLFKEKISTILSRWEFSGRKLNCKSQNEFNVYNH